MNYKTRSAFFFCLLFSMTGLHAHDFWLEAEPFYSKPGSNIDISIYVGEDMFGESLPNIPTHYSDFSYTVNNGRENISGEMARYPAGYFQAPQAGYYTIGYRGRENQISMEGAKFTDYLKKEGLEKIITIREQNQQTGDKAREIYSRCVKTIVKTGKETEVDFSQREFAYTLEITPLQNPYHIAVGESLSVKVSYLGKPLQHTLVIAFTKDAPRDKQYIRTDNDGIAKIDINKKGLWLIKSVEMIPSKRQSIDWESFWASLTFELK